MYYFKNKRLLIMRFFNNQQPLKRNSQVGNEFININFRLFTEKKIICIVCEQTLPVARKKYDLQYHYFNECMFLRITLVLLSPQSRQWRISDHEDKEAKLLISGCFLRNFPKQSSFKKITKQSSFKKTTRSHSTVKINFTTTQWVVNYVCLAI